LAAVFPFYIFLEFVISVVLECLKAGMYFHCSILVQIRMYVYVQLAT